MQSTLRAAFLPLADYWQFLGTSWVLLLRPKPSPLWSPNCPFWEAFRGPWVAQWEARREPGKEHRGTLHPDEGHQTSWSLALQAQGWNFPKGTFCSEAEKKREAGVLAGITFLTHTKLAFMCRADVWIWVPVPASHLSRPLTHPSPLSHPWPSPWSSFSCN